jgi:cellulose synthase/poly-beta-1,6-N-acetylglucosamine synthase-like glycosyltransferase
VAPYEVIFWLSAACIVYTYTIYPLLLVILTTVWGRSNHRRGPFRGSVSIVVSAYNEGANIARRLRELTGLLTTAELDGEVIVVSDGSTDATAAIAQTHARGSIRVLELPDHVGKAAALSAGCAAARNEVIVFADVRQTWAPDALQRLLENFTDPAVGAVSGNLVVESAPGVLAGVGLYWRFEKWLRVQESQLVSMVGVTGAISAVRHEFFQPIPCGTILDDVHWPLQVVMQGHRVVYEEGARAYDRWPKCTRDEFRRKTRTLCGNFQLLTRLPAAFLPWRNPIWFQFFSHKLLRLVVPWALLMLLILSAVLDGPLYQLAFWSQTGAYLLGLAGIWRPGGRARA